MLTEVKQHQQVLTAFFGNYISDNKKNLIEKVLAQRTKYVTLVLEDIFQSQNASAVIRTCECMGLQDVHIIENESKYSVNRRVLKGANKWLDLIRYRDRNANNAAVCFETLRNNGYKIYVADPAPDGLSINDVPVSEKIAIVMGNELHGISRFAAAHADEKVNIPMYGFTESLNVSVSAALCLNTVVPKVRGAGVNWQLDPDEKEFIRYRWYKSCVRRAELLEQEFLKSIK